MVSRLQGDQLPEMPEVPEISSGESDFGSRIIRHTTPGNELYFGLGRPCPRLGCGCFFSCSHDFNLHQKICEERDWKKSDYDDGYFCHASKQPELVHACRIHSGTVKNGLYTYTLSKNGQWLKRKNI